MKKGHLMIEIEIDGKKIIATPGEMIIQAADRHDIYIPRFCYHKKLSIAANCRMCLVEVEKAPKTLPACATPVVQGMKVFTQSDKTIESQKAVMEFLLINHPLDCPICDQGGECELQDLSMGYGKGVSRYHVGKRSVKDKNLGPLIASEMTRCIQCTRCVRFGNEIAGMPELGAIGRGERLEITTYVEQSISSELSGNMIDVCPVGALTNKPYRFTARAWEMKQHESIAPHDCLGSNIYLHTRGEEYTSQRHVMRVVPRENETINETWLSDRDRYAYQALQSERRLLNPRLRQNQTWQEVDWQTALQNMKQCLSEVIRTYGVEKIGAMISPNASLEEGFLFQQWLRGLGIQNIDHRLHQSDFHHEDEPAIFPPLGDLSIAEFERLDGLLLVGSNVRHEQPLLAHRIRQAVKKNQAQIFCLNPVVYDMNFPVASYECVGGNTLLLTLAKILKALQLLCSDITLPAELINFLSTIKVDATAEKIAKELQKAKNGSIVLGAYALNHPQSFSIRLLAHYISQCGELKFATLPEGANTYGLSLSGVLPHRGVMNQPLQKSGLNAKQMFEEKLPAYILFNVEPELDSSFSEMAFEALNSASLVIVFSPFLGHGQEKYAHVLFPVASFAETEATYVNAEGIWQSVAAAATPSGEALPGWKAIVECSRSLTSEPCLEADVELVRDTLKAQYETMISNLNKSRVQTAQKDLKHLIMVLTQCLTEHNQAQLMRVGEWGMYCVDSMVRHAEALQATIPKEWTSIRINSKLAQKLNLYPLNIREGEISGLVIAEQGNSRISLPLVIDERIADDQVFIPMGLAETAGFGEAMGKVKLTTISE